MPKKLFLDDARVVKFDNKGKANKRFYRELTPPQA